MTATPPPASAAAAPLSEAEDRQWASFAHLGGILGILPSLIIYLVFKDRGAFTRSESKEALNFQITVAIAYLAITILSTVLTAVTFGLFGILAPLLYLAIVVVVVLFSIQGFLKSKDGQAYRYPFALRLIK
jgi:uncharacterized protein